MHFSRVAALVVATILFLGLAFTADAVPLNVKETVTTNELIRMRCSHNPDEETYFFFNGTVTAYLGQDTGPSFLPPSSIKFLFNAVGINVARCYKSATGVWYLVGREALWYLNATSDEILTSWNNPLNGETVHVAHVDNDPVMQTFQSAATFPVQVYGPFTTLPSDVTLPLNYVNPIQNPRNVEMDPYSPQTYYQAAELFKFVSPTSEVFSDRDSVDSTFVSWTRTSLFLPWMKMGNRPGYLLYSFQGSKIPDYTSLPTKIKAEIDNRLPHYKHAPEARCFPNMIGTAHSATGGVSSWSFFKENFQNYQNKVAFPLSAARQYPCRNEPAYQPAVDTSCQASASITQKNQWPQGSDTITEYHVRIQNTGTKAIKQVLVDVKFSNVVNSWNLVKQAGFPARYSVDLWGSTIAPGSSNPQPNSYGIHVSGPATVVAVASVVCV